MADTAKLEDWIARVALGDRVAFSRLYDATSAKLFGVCLRILNNRASAEDALQESFMKVWRNADRYRSNGMSPMTWLITIARNTAIDRLRRRRAAGSDDVIEHVADSAPTPEANAVARSEAERIVACLRELDDTRAAAVRGAYLEGLSYAELADKLSVPLNTVRTWLRRSLIALQACMQR
ncbi:sigma-70 family RNA polymerase sigma factor [Arenibacterium halophilum]|uniref:Sigma-70 family RNA polymerase sigma factor n=1 Tax=Arenibacterium halophilum TaxID=2583821 RepID=A0ABY2XAZ8_9RHOB|nr:sigma-70 family RNA polymerase sigma factor [Arenibacterium halophilum]TMV13225.1 sigma-70 family RNA polymerase sigma factor [Arenibacterium halophilum]